ncbi:MAG: hypothetical protein DSY33_01415 [Archaeoglobus sp.]|nr:MAG: hypothetical protein DSY33_01415 [Archaeoglobus sp.]
MYAVRRWDEDTVIKWLAVGMVLAMVGLAVIPATVGSCKLGSYILASEKYGSWQKALAATDMMVAQQLVSDMGGLVELAAASPEGWVAIGAYVGIFY